MTMDNAQVTQDAEQIAREVMAEMLSLPLDECSAESRGARLIREGIRRYAARHRLERSDPVGWMPAPCMGMAQNCTWQEGVSTACACMTTTPPEPVAEIERLREALWTPGEKAWAGLARDLMMAFDMGCRTPREIFQHLDRCGKPIPQWLRDEGEMKHLDHVPSKGTRAMIIYRAMLEPALAALGEAS